MWPYEGLFVVQRNLCSPNFSQIISKIAEQLHDRLCWCGCSASLSSPPAHISLFIVSTNENERKKNSESI